MSDTLRPQGSPWNSPAQNAGVGSLSFLQGIFLIRESNWGLLHCRQILYQLSYQGTKRYIQKLIHFSIKIKVFLKIKIFIREASSLKSEHWLSILIQSPRLSKRKDIWGTSNIQRFQNWVNTAIHRFKKPANPKNLKNKQKLHTDRCTALKLQNLKAA